MITLGSRRCRATRVPHQCLEAALAGLTQRMPDASFTLPSMYPEEDARRSIHIPRLEGGRCHRPLTLGVTRVTINSCALAYADASHLPQAAASLSPAIAAAGPRADGWCCSTKAGSPLPTGARKKFPLIYNIAS